MKTCRNPTGQCSQQIPALEGMLKTKQTDIMLNVIYMSYTFKQLKKYILHVFSGLWLLNIDFHKGVRLTFVLLHSS